MFVFVRLLLAHFIADFPLQTKRFYQFKLRGAEGSFVHSGVFAVFAIALLYPCWKTPLFWDFLLFLWLVHGLQDWLKLVTAERFGVDNIYTFLADQFLHIGFMAIVFLTPLAYFESPVYTSVIGALYANNTALLAISGYVVAIFAGAIIVSYTKKMAEGHKEPLVIDEDWWGKLERFLVLTLLLAGGWWLVLVWVPPLIGGLRARKRKYGTISVVSGFVFTVIIWLLYLFYAR